MSKYGVGIISILLLLTLACSLFVPEAATPTEITAEAEAAETEESPPAGETEPATLEARETITPEPPLETDSGCTLDARFVEDVTVPDNSEIAGGAAFRKTWRIRNTGTCDWDPGTLLVFVSGDPLGGPASVLAPASAAGAQVDLSIDFVAPVTPGPYHSTWQLQTPDGERFGTMFYVKIVVPEAAPPETEAPTETVAPTVTPTEEIGGAIPSGCSNPYDADFALLLDQADVLGIDVGCPMGGAYTAYGAFQEYWANVDAVNPNLHFRSLMIWTTPYKLGEIYLVQGSDTAASDAVIKASYDHWDESLPEIHPDCADLAVPNGYVMPVRGFGRLWCEEQLWETVGWPRSAERAVDLKVQRTENGQLMKISGPNIYSYLVAWHYDDGASTVVMVAP